MAQRSTSNYNTRVYSILCNSSIIELRLPPYFYLCSNALLIGIVMEKIFEGKRHTINKTIHGQFFVLTSKNPKEFFFQI
jgi:hypothetical protein